MALVHPSVRPLPQPTHRPAAAVAEHQRPCRAQDIRNAHFMERTAEGREAAPKLIAQSRHRGEEGTHEMDQHLWPPGPIVEGCRTRGLYYGHVRITAPHFRECPREWARSTDRVSGRQPSHIQSCSTARCSSSTSCPSSCSLARRAANWRCRPCSEWRRDQPRPAETSRALGDAGHASCRGSGSHRAPRLAGRCAPSAPSFARRCLRLAPSMSSRAKSPVGS